MSVKANKTPNPERASFMVLLLLVALVGYNTWSNWPVPAVIQEARAEFSSPADVSSLAADYTLQTSGRNPLVPPAIELSREYRLSSTTTTRPARNPNTTQTAVNTAGNFVMLPAKDAMPSVNANGNTNEPQEKEFPVKIKGIANFPEQGYRLVIIDKDGEYTRLAEGDEWEKDGETLQIRKIEPTKVVFLDKDGKPHVLELDLMDMTFDSKSLGSSDKKPENAPEGDRPPPPSGGGDSGKNGPPSGANGQNPPPPSGGNNGNKGGGNSQGGKPGGSNDKGHSDNNKK